MPTADVHTEAPITEAICGRCHIPIPAGIERCRLCYPGAGASSAPPARIGPYPVLRCLAEGPVARVYECADALGQPTIAVKVFRVDDESARNQGERRLREARSWARLGHAAVLPTHSVGRWCNSPFLAMARAGAGSVEERLAGGATLAPVEALRIVSEAASALEAGAALGLLHRAVKPSNLLLESDGRVRLADPGVAGRPANALPSDVPECGPDPLAPELRDGLSADCRADIYALGVSLGRMLGAYADRSPGDTSGEPSPAVRRILLGMTAHNREDRIRNWAELRIELARAISTIDPVAIETRAAASRGWASAGALTGFVVAAAISAFLPPPEPVLPGAAVAHARSTAPPAAIASFAGLDSAADAPVDGPVGDARPALLHEPFLAPASHSFVMGSEDVSAAFDVESAGAVRKPRRLGGRILIPSGQPMTWLHRSDVSGDVRAELDVVLNPGAAAGIVLRSPDGRELRAQIRAWSVRPAPAQHAALEGQTSVAESAGVLLSGGEAQSVVAGLVLGVSPGRAHHVELRRSHDEVRLRIDGREVLRTELPLAGSYRVGCATPTGGVELRAFSYAADREHPVNTES